MNDYNIGVNTHSSGGYDQDYTDAETQKFLSEHQKLIDKPSELSTQNLTPSQIPGMAFNRKGQMVQAPQPSVPEPQLSQVEQAPQPASQDVAAYFTNPTEPRDVDTMVEPMAIETISEPVPVVEPKTGVMSIEDYKAQAQPALKTGVMSIDDYKTRELGQQAKDRFSDVTTNKELGMVPVGKALDQIDSLTDLGGWGTDVDAIQAYTQQRLQEQPDIMATKILRELKGKFGQEAMDPDVLLTIRSYMRNPHSLSAPGGLEALASGGLAMVEGLGQTLAGAGSTVSSLFDEVMGTEPVPATGIMSVEDYKANKHKPTDSDQPSSDVTAWFDDKAETLGKRAEQRNQGVLAQAGAMAPMLAAPAKVLPTAAAALSYELGQGNTGLDAVGSAAMDVGLLKVGSLLTKLIDKGGIDISQGLSLDQLKKVDEEAHKTITQLANKQGIQPEQVLNEALNYSKLSGRKYPDAKGLEATAIRMDPTLTKEKANAIKKAEGVGRALQEGQARTAMGIQHTSAQALEPYAKQVGDNTLVDFPKAYEDFIYAKGSLQDWKRVNHYDGPLDELAMGDFLKDNPNVSSSMAKQIDIADPVVNNLADMEESLRTLSKFDDMNLAINMLNKDMGKPLDSVPKGYFDEVAHLGSPVPLPKTADTSGLKSSSSRQGIKDNVRVSASYMPGVGVPIRLYTYLRNKLPGREADVLMQKLVTDMAKGQARLPGSDLYNYLREAGVSNELEEAVRQSNKPKGPTALGQIGGN